MEPTDTEIRGFSNVGSVAEWAGFDPDQFDSVEDPAGSFLDALGVKAADPIKAVGRITKEDFEEVVRSWQIQGRAPKPAQRASALALGLAARIACGTQTAPSKECDDAAQAAVDKVSMQKLARKEKWEINRSDVHVNKQLSGTLKSSVYHATWNGVDVVAKFIKPDAEDLGDFTSEALEQEMLHEIAVLAPLRHPDLVMFLGCCLQESPMMFITQFMPKGDVQHYYSSLSSDGTVRTAPKKTVNNWGRSVLRALNYLHCHSPQVVHRDLKPLNILLTENLEAKVTDFGISKEVTTQISKTRSDKSEGQGRAMTGGVGTWYYMAPEVARHQFYTEKADIYSFGLVLYFMSCGRFPFREYKDPVRVLNEFSEGKEPRPKASECPSQFRPIMEAAWDKDPEKRPSAAELCERMAEIRGGAYSCACAPM